MAFRPVFYSEPSDSVAAYERWKQQQAAKQAAKQAPGYAIGKGVGGLAGAYAGKYLAGQVGSLFGGGGTAAAVPTVAELPAATSMLPGASPLATSGGITGGGGIGGGAGGGAASAGGAPAGLSSVASYAVPAAIALATAYNIHKLTGGGVDSDREAGRWKDAVARGYKYGPDSFDTVADPTAGELADKSGIAALLLGNAWHDNFTPEERAGIMEKVRADPGAHFNERLGGYEYDKGILAKYAQELASSKGQGDWVMGRYEEQKKRDDRDRDILLGRGPNALFDDAPNPLKTRGPYRDYLSADWMPEGSSVAESLADAVAAGSTNGERTRRLFGV